MQIRGARGAAALAALVLVWWSGGHARVGAGDDAGAVSLPDAWVLRNVRVFDGEQALPRATVLVRDGRIAAVGATAAPAAVARTIDGEGLTLLPGLIDAHGHVRGQALRDHLAFGVTTVLDMSTEVAWAARMRHEQRAGRGIDRADLFSAGTLATAPGGHGTAYEAIPTLSSPEEAQAFVDARIGEGSDYIKIVYDDNRTFGEPVATISKATLAALIDASHRRHKLAVVHIGAVSGARDALAAGADALVHLSPDGRWDAELVALARQRGAFVIPTLSLNESMCGTASGADLVADARTAPFLSSFAAKTLNSSYRFDPTHRHDFSAVLATVARLRQAGVPILAGTDAPNPGTAHGASIHRELELLVRAGLTPIEALRASTSETALAFGLSDRGRIAAGLRADLLLVRGDPTRDIRATRDIVTIWKGGHSFDRDGYRATLKRDTKTAWFAASAILAVVALAVRRRQAGRSNAPRGRR